jgi:hypothetical protein
MRGLATRKTQSVYRTRALGAGKMGYGPRRTEAASRAPARSATAGRLLGLVPIEDALGPVELAGTSGRNSSRWNCG